MTDFLVTNTDGGANLREAPNLSSKSVNLPFATTLKLLADDGSPYFEDALAKVGAE